MVQPESPYTDRFSNWLDQSLHWRVLRNIQGVKISLEKYHLNISTSYIQRTDNLTGINIWSERNMYWGFIKGMAWSDSLMMIWEIRLLWSSAVTHVSWWKCLGVVRWFRYIFELIRKWCSFEKGQHRTIFLPYQLT